MQQHEALRGFVSERLMHQDGPRMGPFMYHLHDFLRRNQVLMVHGSNLYEFGYIDPKSQRGLYYTAQDRVHNPHKTWIFERPFGERKTQVRLIDDYNGESTPVQVYGKESLIEAIAKAEEYLIEAQGMIIKSHLKNG